MKKYVRTIVDYIKDDIIFQINNSHYPTVTKETAPYMFDGALLTLKHLDMISSDDHSDIIYNFIDNFCKGSKAYERIILKKL